MSFRSRGLPPALVVAALACLPAASLGAAADEHAEAIRLARAGEHGAALKLLDGLVAARPAEAAYAHDRVLVMGWAERDADALAAADALDMARMPVPVLAAAARSARQLRRFDVALRYGREALRRDPLSTDARLGVALTLVGQGKGEAAEAALVAIETREPGRADVSEARALAAEARDDSFQALAFWQQALERAPGRPALLRGLARTTAKLGAPKVALALAESHGGLLPGPELEALRVDGTAAAIRWGQVEERLADGDARWAWADRALADSEAASRAFAEGAQPDAQQRRLLADRLLALSLRRRPAELVALHRRLVDRGIEPPAYVLGPVGDALLTLRRPQEALGPLRAAHDAADAAERPGLAMLVFYALVESERLDEARDWIDAQVKDLPVRLKDGRPSPELLSARVAAAMLRVWRDEPAAARRMTDALLADAPWSASVRETWASLLASRERPRAADAALLHALASDPDSAALHAGRVDPLIERHDYAQALAALADAWSLRPDDGRVLRAMDSWRIHDSPQLSIDVGRGRSSSGTPAGRDDFRIDTLLYSAPLLRVWRAFLHDQRVMAGFADGDASWRRSGVGIEWRVPDWRVAAELVNGRADVDAPAAGLDFRSRTGVALDARWQPVDEWQFAADFASVSSAIPLQARRAGIGGRDGGLGLAWTPDAWRRVAAGVRRVAFDDGNDRDIASLAWTERGAFSPYWRWDATAGVYASRNGRPDAPYFNPRSDTSLSLEGGIEWLTWRRYDQRFSQRLAAGIGSYRQQGFGAGDVLSLRYEHIWSLSRRVSLRYGIGRLLRPYDGVRTGRTEATGSLDWKF